MALSHRSARPLSGARLSSRASAVRSTTVDRRCDALFRDLIEQVLPGLTYRDFALDDRGTFREFRWVEFARRRSDQQLARLYEQNLVLYHLAEHQHVGARLSQRGLLGSAPTERLAAQVWPYVADARLTPAGHPLSALLHDWVTTAVDDAGHLPPGPDAG
jgi:hypothetical protein